MTGIRSAAGDGTLGTAAGRVAGAVISDRVPGLARMPADADLTAPPYRAWCRACHGTRWWTERHEPRGWRCMTCHPSAHLAADAIKREGEGEATPLIGTWWVDRDER